MTRFDEALRDFAAANEDSMRARVGSDASHELTLHQLGKARKRRAAVQATATVAAVAIAATGAWYLSGAPNTADPVAPNTVAPDPEAPVATNVDTIAYLGDPLRIDEPAFACGVPFPLEAGVNTTAADLVLPSVTQDLAYGANATAPLDLRPGGATVATENSVMIEAFARWRSDEPVSWGTSTYAVLVDGQGNVVSRSFGFYPAGQTTAGDAPMQYMFVPDSCELSDEFIVNESSDSDALNGTFGVHIVTQLWLDVPSTPVAQWVDVGLPADAQITIDSSTLEAELEQAHRTADEVRAAAEAAIERSGESLATVSGPAIAKWGWSCKLNLDLEEVGTGGISAMPVDMPAAVAILEPTKVTWTYAASEGAPWWAPADMFDVVYLDANGEFVSMAQGGVGERSEDAGTVTLSADLRTPGPECGINGVPTEPGTYQAYATTDLAYFGEGEAPASLPVPAGFLRVLVWAPLGTYTVP